MTRYPTKVDGWIAALVFGGMLVVLAALASIFFDPTAPLSARTGLILAAVFYAALILGLAWPVSYELSSEALTVSSGWFVRMRVPLSSLLAVAPSRNPLSAPAWSLDRLRIDYVRPSGRKSFLLVSPKERTAFLEELAKLAKLERSGERWVRPDAQSRGGDV